MDAHCDAFAHRDAIANPDRHSLADADGRRPRRQQLRRHLHLQIRHLQRLPTHHRRHRLGHPRLLTHHHRAQRRVRRPLRRRHPRRLARQHRPVHRRQRQPRRRSHHTCRNVLKRHSAPVQAPPMTLYEAGTATAQARPASAPRPATARADFTMSYTPPSPAGELYVVALGGDAGDDNEQRDRPDGRAGLSNAFRGLIKVNELTTVAGAWALGAVHQLHRADHRRALDQRDRLGQCGQSRPSGSRRYRERAAPPLSGRLMSSAPARCQRFAADQL